MTTFWTSEKTNVLYHALKILDWWFHTLKYLLYVNIILLQNASGLGFISRPHEASWQVFMSSFYLSRVVIISQVVCGQLCCSHAVVCVCVCVLVKVNPYSRQSFTMRFSLSMRTLASLLFEPAKVNICRAGLQLPVTFDQKHMAHHVMTVLRFTNQLHHVMDCPWARHWMQKPHKKAYLEAWGAKFKPGNLWNKEVARNVGTVQRQPVVENKENTECYDIYIYIYACMHSSYMHMNRMHAYMHAYRCGIVNWLKGGGG